MKNKLAVWLMMFAMPGFATPMMAGV